MTITVGKILGIVSIFIGIGLAVFLGIYSNSQSASLQSLQEAVQIEVEQNLHFGTIYPGTIRKSLVIRNLSSHSIIPRIRSSCGCVRNLTAPSSIPQHSDGTIEFELDTRQISGQFSRDLLVYVEGMAEQTSKRVTLTGTVITDGLLQFDTDFIDFGTVRCGDTGTARIAVQRKNGGILDGCPLSVTDPCISAKLHVDPAQPSRGMVTLEYRPDRYPQAIHAQLTISDPAHPALSANVLVVGNSEGDVHIQPKAILLGRITPHAEVDTSLVITSDSQSDILVNMVSATLPLKLQASLAKEENSWILRVHGTCKAPPDTAIKGYVQLAITSGTHNDVIIPIMGIMGD